MPNAAPHPCNHPCCHVLIDGSARCEQHTIEQARGMQRRSDAKRCTATERGYGTRWRKLRAYVLAQEPLCRECRERGRLVPATDVDHVVSRRRGGTDHAGNLQPLCHSCHSRKTVREDGGGWQARGGGPKL